MALYPAPCCHRPVDVPVDAVALDESLLLCPHCGAALAFRKSELRIEEPQIGGSLAGLLALLQDMQACPENYLPPEGDELAAGRGTPAAPGVH